MMRRPLKKQHCSRVMNEVQETIGKSNSRPRAWGRGCLGVILSERLKGSNEESGKKLGRRD